MKTVFYHLSITFANFKFYTLWFLKVVSISFKGSSYVGESLVILLLLTFEVMQSKTVKKFKHLWSWLYLINTQILRCKVYFIIYQQFFPILNFRHFGF